VVPVTDVLPGGLVQLHIDLDEAGVVVEVLVDGWRWRRRRTRLARRTSTAAARRRTVSVNGWMSPELLMKYWLN